MPIDLDPRTLYTVISEIIASNEFTSSNNTLSPALDTHLSNILKITPGDMSYNAYSDMYTRLKTFFDNSKTMSEINQNDAVYNYINTMHINQVKELGQQNKSLLNKTQVTKQLYRKDDYNANAMAFYTAFIKYTLLVSSIIFILAALTLTGTIGTRACFIASVIIIALFTTVFMLNISSNMTRLKTNWNKYDWGSVHMTNDANMKS